MNLCIRNCGVAVEFGLLFGFELVIYSGKKVVYGVFVGFYGSYLYMIFRSIFFSLVFGDVIDGK